MNSNQMRREPQGAYRLIAVGYFNFKKITKNKNKLRSGIHNE